MACGGLDMGPELHAQLARSRLHAVDVALHPGDIDQGCWSGQLLKTGHGRGVKLRGKPREGPAFRSIETPTHAVKYKFWQYQYTADMNLPAD